MFITIITTTNILILIAIVTLFMLCPLRALTQTALKNIYICFIYMFVSLLFSSNICVDNVLQCVRTPREWDCIVDCECSKRSKLKLFRRYGKCAVSHIKKNPFFPNVFG